MNNKQRKKVMDEDVSIDIEEYSVTKGVLHYTCRDCDAYNEFSFGSWVEDDFGDDEEIDDECHECGKVRTFHIKTNINVRVK